MLCPKCGERWRVRSTTTAEWSKRERGEHAAYSTEKDDLVTWAERVVGWYTDDFVVRMRYCGACGYESRSIEIIEEDVDAVLRNEHE